MKPCSKLMLLCFLGMLAGMVWFTPLMAQTAAPAASTTSSNNDTCTTFSQRMQQMNSSTPSADPNSGLLSSIYLYIQQVVNGATQTLFQAFTNNSDYQNAVFAAMTLMIVVFGVGFTIGIIQVSFGQALIRLIKIGIVATIISPDGWQFFSDYVVTFFANGTDDIVSGVMAIGTGVTPPAGSTPFYQLDSLATFILTPDTLSAIGGSLFNGGPFGMAMGGLMGFAFWGFIKMIVEALRTYAVCYVARALILGVAPIFIVFLLFDKTKTLFQGWVNLLVNFSLQPILLFTFLSFFVVMISSATQSMFGAELCWTEAQAVTGTTNRVSMWRFVDPNTKQPDLSEQTWQGSLSCVMGGSSSNCPSFPINIVDILSFLILVYIAQRFSTVIEKISSELSNAFVSLDAGGRFDQYLEQKSQQGGGILSSAAKQASGATGSRTNPG